MGFAGDSASMQLRVLVLASRGVALLNWQRHPLTVSGHSQCHGDTKTRVGDRSNGDTDRDTDGDTDTDGDYYYEINAVESNTRPTLLRRWSLEALFSAGVRRTIELAVHMHVDWKRNIAMLVRHVKTGVDGLLLDLSDVRRVRWFHLRDVDVFLTSRLRIRPNYQGWSDKGTFANVELEDADPDSNSNSSSSSTRFLLFDQRGDNDDKYNDHTANKVVRACTATAVPGITVTLDKTDLIYTADCGSRVVLPLPQFQRRTRYTISQVRRWHGDTVTVHVESSRNYYFDVAILHPIRGATLLSSLTRTASKKCDFIGVHYDVVLAKARNRDHSDSSMRIIDLTSFADVHASSSRVLSSRDPHSIVLDCNGKQTVVPTTPMVAPGTPIGRSVSAAGFTCVGASHGTLCLVHNNSDDDVLRAPLATRILLRRLAGHELHGLKLVDCVRLPPRDTVEDGIRSMLQAASSHSMREEAATLRCGVIAALLQLCKASAACTHVSAGGLVPYEGKHAVSASALVDTVVVCMHDIMRLPDEHENALHSIQQRRVRKAIRSCVKCGYLRLRLCLSVKDMRISVGELSEAARVLRRQTHFEPSERVKLSILAEPTAVLTDLWTQFQQENTIGTRDLLHFVHSLSWREYEYSRVADLPKNVSVAWSNGVLDRVQSLAMAENIFRVEFLLLPSATRVYWTWTPEAAKDVTMRQHSSLHVAASRVYAVCADPNGCIASRFLLPTNDP
ncbi:MAG: hypothetical protein MHM6MM_003642 [Cercozoa sp. M6MM]